MKIAVVDDKQEELERAKKAVEEKGHEAIVLHVSSKREILSFVPRIDEADCVITDLIFNPLRDGFGASQYYNTNPPPAGLLIVVYSLAKGKPVVVCTNTFEAGGHHGEAIGWIYDGSGGFFSCGRRHFSFYNKEMHPSLPLGWEEEKDWDRAVKMAEELKTLHFWKS